MVIINYIAKLIILLSSMNNLEINVVSIKCFLDTKSLYMWN